MSVKDKSIEMNLHANSVEVIHALVSRYNDFIMDKMEVMTSLYVTILSKAPTNMWEEVPITLLLYKVHCKEEMSVVIPIYQ